MAEHWNFDDDHPAVPVEEGPSFTLGGETFRCLPALAGGTIPAIVAATRLDNRGKNAVSNPDLLQFIEDCLIIEERLPDPTDDNPDQTRTEVTDDVARWQALMADKRRPIQAQTVGDIATRLVEHYTKRPTSPPRR